MRISAQNLELIVEICRVRPRKNFLSVLNRASMIKVLQKELKVIQAIEQAPRPPRCMETMPMTLELTKNISGIK